MNKAIIDTIQTYCREGNRESVLNVFQNFPEHFSCIPLTDSNVESKQAINDLLRENVGSRKKLSREIIRRRAENQRSDCYYTIHASRFKVILNGVKFFGHGELFLESLRQVVEILSRSPDYKGGRTGSEIVERVLCKASRTTSGSDSYFTVGQLFTNSDYLLKPRAERLPPINVEVFLVDNSIHSIVACANYYGLFSLDEIEAESQSFRVHTPQAWLRLDTMVVEKTDYLTGRNVRYLRVDTPDLPSSQPGPLDGMVHTPPPRDSVENDPAGGGGGGDGNKSVGPSTLNAWAQPQINLNTDRLFGDVSSRQMGATGGSIAREAKGSISKW